MLLLLLSKLETLNRPLIPARIPPLEMEWQAARRQVAAVLSTPMLKGRDDGHWITPTTAERPPSNKGHEDGRKGGTAGIHGEVATAKRTEEPDAAIMEPIAVDEPFARVKSEVAVEVYDDAAAVAAAATAPGVRGARGVSDLAGRKGSVNRRRSDGARSGNSALGGVMDGGVGNDGNDGGAGKVGESRHEQRPAYDFGASGMVKTGDGKEGKRQRADDEKGTRHTGVARGSDRYRDIASEASLRPDDAAASVGSESPRGTGRETTAANTAVGNVVEGNLKPTIFPDPCASDEDDGRTVGEKADGGELETSRKSKRPRKPKVPYTG